MNYIILAIGIIIGSSIAYASDNVLKDFGQSPEFEGIDSNNNTFISSKVLKDKISIVNFFFTSCDGPCPSLMLTIKKVLTKTECANVHFVSISVDSDNDSSSILKKYQVSRGFDSNNWSFITMKDDDLTRLLNDGFKLGSGEEIVNHSTRIVVIDSEYRVRALVPGMDHNTISKTVETIEKLCR